MPSLSKLRRGFDSEVLKSGRGFGIVGSRRRQNSNRPIPDLAGKQDSGLKDLLGFRFLFWCFCQDRSLIKLREHGPDQVIVALSN